MVSRGRFQPLAAKGYRSLVRCAPSHGRRRLAPAFAASRSSARCSTRSSAATAHPPRWAVGCSTRRGPLAPSRPLTTGLIRWESISRCSKCPSYRRRWGSTSFEPRAPRPVGGVAAGPTPAEVPRAPTPPGRSGRPDVASRGSDSSPSPPRCPRWGSTDRPGTSDRRVAAPGPPQRRCHRPGPERTASTRRPPRSQSAAPRSLQSPSPKNFPRRGSGQVVIRIRWEVPSAAPAAADGVSSSRGRARRRSLPRWQDRR